MASTQDKRVDGLTNLLTRLVVAMVDHPKAVEVRSSRSSSGVEFRLRVAAPDTRRVIGRGAQNHKALAMVLRMAGERVGLDVRLARLDEPGPARHEPIRKSAIDWEATCALLLDTVRACVEFPEEMLLKRGAIDRLDSPKVVTSRAEDPYRIVLLDGAVQKIFRCVGQKHGFELLASVVRAGEPPQPLTADGRFAGEVKR